MGDVVKRTLKDGTVARYARFINHEGKRVALATGADNDDDAERWLERAELRAAAGLPVEANSSRRWRRRAPAEQPKPLVAPAPAMTLRELCEQFCGYVADEAQRFHAGAGGENADPVHYRRQAWSVLKCHVLTPELEQRPAAELRRADIVKLKDALTSAGKSAFIVSRALRQLGRVYNWAVERELLVENPCRAVKKPKTQGTTVLYNDDEVAKLLAWAAENDSELHPLVAFAFYTGCRKGEIAALRWSDIDWQGARVVVQRSWKRPARKSGKPVVVNLHAHLVAILAALQQRTGGEGEQLVFPAPPTRKKRRTKPDAPNGWMRDKFDLWGLDKAIAAKKVRRFRNPWHAFRHTHATGLAAGGAGLTAIRDALGQATLHMAANYTHLAAEHVRQHVAKLPALGPTSPTVASLDAARARGKAGKKIAREADTATAAATRS